MNRDEMKRRIDDAMRERAGSVARSAKLASLILNINQEDQSEASKLWNDIISMHPDKEKRFYIGAIYRRMWEMVTADVATGILLKDMSRAMDYIIYNNISSIPSRMADLVIALLERDRLSDALSLIRQLIEKDNNPQSVFRSMSYYLYYALGPDYGAVYGEQRIKRDELIKLYRGLLSCPNVDEMMHQDIDYLCSIIAEEQLEDKKSVILCFTFAAETRIVPLRTLFMNRKLFSIDELRETIELYYKEYEPQKKQINLVGDNSKEIAEWVYGFVIQAEPLNNLFVHQGYTEYVRWMLKKLIRGREKVALVKELNLILNETGDYVPARSVLMSLIRHSDVILYVPPKEDTKATIGDVDISITVTWNPTRFEFHSPETQFARECFQSREDAVWFLEVLDEILKSTQVATDTHDFEEAISKARIIEEPYQFSVSIPLKNVLSS